MSGKGEQTRNEIIAAAKTLFYHRGYSQTSFSDIVDQTGIRRGNINHYFKTKNDILKAVIERRVGECKDLFSSWDSRYSDPKARLQCFVKMVAENKGDLVRYGCPIGTLNAELGKESCDFPNLARVLFDVFLEWLTVQFKQLGGRGQAKAHALHLLGRAEGVSLMAHVYNDPVLITAEVRILVKWINEL